MRIYTTRDSGFNFFRSFLLRKLQSNYLQRHRNHLRTQNFKLLNKDGEDLVCLLCRF